MPHFDIDSVGPFIVGAEAAGGRPLTFRKEVAELLRAVAERNMFDEFDRLTFEATFIVRAGKLMERIGPAGNGFDRISAEVETALGRARGHLRRLLEGANAGMAGIREHDFLAAEKLGEFLPLLADLSSVRLYEKDAENRSASSPPGVARRAMHMSVLCAALTAAFVTVDPPATVTGWVLLLGIEACCVALFFLSRQLNSPGSSKERIQ